MNKIQKQAMADFFNNDGYVLDFSDLDFNRFTQNSIGIPLKEHYGLSKAKSLASFIDEGDEDVVNKLLNDLFEYYELKGFYIKEDETTKETYNKLKGILKDNNDNTFLMLDSLLNLDSDYIKKLVSRSRKHINNGDYDSAISTSKSLLEAIFRKAIECKGESHTKNDDFNVLYSRVRKLYGMSQNKEVDKRINDLLNGLNKIISAISEMRNIAGDSHGYGSNLVNIDKHTAILFTNSSYVLSEYILCIIEKKK